MKNETIYQRYFWVSIFAIAIALWESAVVVYLRELYYPSNLIFPLKIIPVPMAIVEFLREIATILAIWAISYIKGKDFVSRFAYFIYIFGIWDIFYYVFLKLFISWPISILEFDLLFLIPLPWSGPVLAPVLISITFIIAGIFAINYINKGYQIKVSKNSWLIAILGIIILFYSFIINAGEILYGGIPRSYSWGLFALGEACLIFSTYREIKKLKTKVNEIGEKNEK